jgi:hypothetical protein
VVLSRNAVILSIGAHEYRETAVYVFKLYKIPTQATVSQNCPTNGCADVKIEPLYTRSNLTKSPASGAGNVSEPRLMSQVGSVSVDQCVSAVRAVEVPALVCLRSSCSYVTEVRGP